MHAFIRIPLLFGATSVAQKLISRNFPHLIIPLRKDFPDTPQGTQKIFDIERDIWTETSFDVPAVDAVGCGLGFTINNDPARGAPWHVWGGDSFKFNISALPPKVNKDADTWNTRPSPIEWIATVEVWPTGGVSMSGGDWFACKKGEIAQFLMYPADLDKDGGLWWYELEDPLHGLTYNMYGAS